MPIAQILNVYRHDKPNRTLITLAGEIDLSSAPLLRESLEQCLRDGIRTIDVDLTAVTFCDCSGLDAFLGAVQRTAAAGGSLRLRHPSALLSRLLALTGTGSLLLGVPGAHVLPPLPDDLIESFASPQRSPLSETLHQLAPVMTAVAGGVL
ncbi:STAS domain-containing protein [Streptomyces sp. NPDC054933]